MEEAGKENASGRSRMLIPVAALLLGGGAGVGIGWFVASSKAETTGEAAAAEGEEAPAGEHGAAPAAEGGEEAAKAEGGAAAHGEGAGKSIMTANGSAVTGLGTFTVNLRGGGGGRVLRVEVQVEGPAAQASDISSRSAQIRDTIITAISDYTWNELEGAGGKTRLRDELLARVNGAAAPSTIERIYFTQFVVQ